MSPRREPPTAPGPAFERTPVTRAELDARYGGVVRVISGPCHVGAHVVAYYDPPTGVLRLTCGRCHALVVNIAVAASEAPP